jgi:Domain of unknown function (DUF397)
MPARPDRYPAATWRKSIASADQGACVEIAVQESFVLVRDSRDENGTILKFTFGQWIRLMEHVRKGPLGGG